MKPVNTETLFARFIIRNPPASQDLIGRCQQRLTVQLPTDYKRLLQQMNGGEGFIGTQYLQLWPIEEVVKTNTEADYGNAALEFLLFGSDGGGESFAFDTRSMPRIVAVPFIGMERSAAILLAQDFASFLQFLYGSDDLF
jgi:hypothetical protein